MIACGLAVAAAEHDEVLLWARSRDSAHRAHKHVVKIGAKLNGFDPDRVRIVTNLDELGGATFLVEAVDRLECRPRGLDRSPHGLRRIRVGWGRS